LAWLNRITVGSLFDDSMSPLRGFADFRVLVSGGWRKSG